MALGGSHLLGVVSEHYLTIPAALFVAYNLVLVTYRLVFSPLARFPGPKIAAATGYYEFYHDYFRKGQYVKVIKSLHEKYGELQSFIK